MNSNPWHHDTPPVLLLWDIDGTILRVKGAGRRAMTAAFLDTFGIPDAFTEVPMAGSLDLNFMVPVFKAYSIDEEALEEFLSVYYQALIDELALHPPDLCAGVTEILQRTETYGNVYNAIGTGNVEVGGRIKLDVFDLNEYFPVGGFCERPGERFEVLRQGVEQAEAYYGVEFEPSQVIVIGDTLHDIRAARAIKARVIAVATGGNTYAELEAERPDLLLEDLTDPDRFFAFVQA